MAYDFVPAKPVVVSSEPLTFFGQHGAHISGTEDLSGLPNGDSIEIRIINLSIGTPATRTPVPVNSDGTWDATFACTSGDQAYATAVAVSSNGEPGANNSGPVFTLP